jgi:hypothetical protein
VVFGSKTRNSPSFAESGYCIEDAVVPEIVMKSSSSKTVSSGPALSSPSSLQVTERAM